MLRDWTPIFERVAREDARRRESRIAAATVPSRESVALAPMNDFDRGCVVMDRTLEAIARFDRPPYARYVMQVRFQRLALSTTCAYIFRGAYVTRQIDIARRYRFQSTATNLLARAPRRMGKSVAVAMILAALLVSVPQYRILIVANSRAAATKSRGILGQVADYLVAFPNLVYTTNNETTIKLRFGPNDVRSIHSSSDTSVSYSFSSLPPSLSRSLALIPSCGILSVSSELEIEPSFGTARRQGAANVSLLDFAHVLDRESFDIRLLLLVISISTKDSHELGVVIVVERAERILHVSGRLCQGPDAFATGLWVGRKRPIDRIADLDLLVARVFDRGDAGRLDDRAGRRVVAESRDELGCLGRDSDKGDRVGQRVDASSLDRILARVNVRAPDTFGALIRQIGSVQCGGDGQ
jgi:hypothetical protein